MTKIELIYGGQYSWNLISLISANRWLKQRKLAHFNGLISLGLYYTGCGVVDNSMWGLLIQCKFWAVPVTKKELR